MDGAIFFAIGIWFENKKRAVKSRWFHLTMTKEQRRLQELAGITHDEQRPD